MCCLSTKEPVNFVVEFNIFTFCSEAGLPRALGCCSSRVAQDAENLVYIWNIDPAREQQLRVSSGLSRAPVFSVQLITLSIFSSELTPSHSAQCTTHCTQWDHRLHLCQVLRFLSTFTQVSLSKLVKIIVQWKSLQLSSSLNCKNLFHNETIWVISVDSKYLSIK